VGVNQAIAISNATDLAVLLELITPAAGMSAALRYQAEQTLDARVNRGTTSYPSLVEARSS